MIPNDFNQMILNDTKWYQMILNDNQTDVHVSQIASLYDLYNYMYVTNLSWILDFFFSVDFFLTQQKTSFISAYCCLQ